MLIGIIKKENNKYYYKLDEGKNEVSCVNVCGTEIKPIGYEDAKTIIKNTFNSELTYKTTYNGYDIYLDSNNYIRFFKDNKEDFNLFYKNNGTEAVVYNSTYPYKSLMKAFTFVVSGVTTLAIFTYKGIDIIQNFSFLENQGVEYSDEASVDCYTQADLSRIKKYIDSSDGLSQEQKELIYNEDLINKVLTYSSESRLLYDFNERFRDINTKTYEGTLPDDPYGYYTGGNSIYMLDSLDSSSLIYKNTLRHEFVHLLQNHYEYTYIIEGVTEILRQEYYSYNGVYTYPTNIRDVKLLMEVIGPEPFMQMCFEENGDNIFQEEIKKYLNEEETADFLSLIKGYGFEDPEKGNEITEKINNYICEMYQNKYDKPVPAALLDAITDCELTSRRFYFNDKKEEFYNLTKLKKDESIKKTRIQYIIYSNDKYDELIQSEDFIKFTKSFKEMEYIKSLWDEKEKRYVISLSEETLTEEQIRSGEYNNYFICLKYNDEIDYFDIDNEFYEASTDALVRYTLDDDSSLDLSKRDSVTSTEEPFLQHSIYAASIYEKFYKSMEKEKTSNDIDNDIDAERN